MAVRISKSRFKAQALEFFRRVEHTGEAVVITDRGRPVLRLVPYEDDPAALLGAFRGCVRGFDRPLDPVGEHDWEAES